MKYRISVLNEIEVEINNDSSLQELTALWKSLPPRAWESVPEDLITKSIKEVEVATGLPFGDVNAPKTVISVVDIESGEGILEW